MNVYKLGNNVNCILRSTYAGQQLGEMKMQFINQPYTVLNEIDARVTFLEKTATNTAINAQLKYDIDYVDTIYLNNVPLTEKVLQLVFPKYANSMINTSVNIESRGNLLYLSDKIRNVENVEQVFVYDVDGVLIYPTSEQNGDFITNPWLNVLNINEPIAVPEADSDYKVFYSYEATGSNLTREQNIYLTLDLEVIGNIGDTQDLKSLDDTQQYCLHFDRCSLSINKNLFFNNSVNTIDLTFKVIHPSNHSGENYDYISWKENN